MSLKVFGEYLKQLRENRGFKLREVAQKTGIMLADLDRYERAFSPIHPNSIRTLAEFYGVSYIDLMVIAGYFPKEETGISESEAHLRVFRKIVH